MTTLKYKIIKCKYCDFKVDQYAYSLMLFHLKETHPEVLADFLRTQFATNSSNPIK